MELIEHQTYNAWYKALGNKLLDWHEAKPDNKDLINLVKAVEVIGVHNARIVKENRQLEFELQSLKEKLKETIEDLNSML